MNTHTRLTPFFVVALLALMVSACKPRIVIGPQQTFTVDMPRPESGKSIGTQARRIWTLKPHKDGTMFTTEESMVGRQDSKMEMKRRRHG